MTAITALQLSKAYSRYDHAADRLWEAITGRERSREFVALQPLDLTIEPGEVVGLVGMNGAGKSTLLKLIAGVLAPSSGAISVKGRVSALLELGAGFHPELSGNENIRMACAVMGLSTTATNELVDEIIEFSGIGEFINQQVKTYSSGMFVRLAFSVATCVEPEILIVDEALSVGDGAFARKSFDRIMSLKDKGKTILFCSHSLYQIEALCTRAIWLNQGHLVMDGNPAAVTAKYNQFLDTGILPGAIGEEKQTEPVLVPEVSNINRFLSIQAYTQDGVRSEKVVRLQTGKSDLMLDIHFQSDPNLQPPSVAVTVNRLDGSIIASIGTHNDGLTLKRDDSGQGVVTVTLPAFPLLKGQYWISAYLLCENALHVYDQAPMAVELDVEQLGLEQGIVSLNRKWKV